MNQLELNDYLSKYGLDKISISLGKKITEDQIIISTYPNHQHYIDNIQSFTEDILENYFKINSTVQPINNNDFILKRCCKLLNIPYENRDLTDEFYLSSLRRVWESLILERKEILLENLKKEDFLAPLSEEEKEEYLEEIKIYNQRLSKDHTQNLNELKTIKDIISYWPPEIQPIPDFVYYEY